MVAAAAAISTEWFACSAEASEQNSRLAFDAAKALEAMAAVDKGLLWMESPEIAKRVIKHLSSIKML